MKEYLAGVCETKSCGKLPERQKDQRTVTAVDDPKGARQTGKVNLLNGQAELTNLFTDVAALTREKSQFKIYTNYCYTVDRSSKPVVIEINYVEDEIDTLNVDSPHE